MHGACQRHSEFLTVFQFVKVNKWFRLRVPALPWDILTMSGKDTSAFGGNRGLDGPAGTNVPVGRFLLRRPDLKRVGHAAYLGQDPQPDSPMSQPQPIGDDFQPQSPPPPRQPVFNLPCGGHRADRRRRVDPCRARLWAVAGPGPRSSVRFAFIPLRYSGGVHARHLCVGRTVHLRLPAWRLLCTWPST